MFCGIFIYFFSINAPFECILHKSYYIYITIKFQQIFTFFRPFLLHSYNTYYVRVGGNADGYIDTTFTVGSTDTGRAKGDIVGTNAGEINLDDIFAVKQISASYGTWDADQLKAADVVGTNEGEVNLDDVFAIMQASAGMDVTFKK